jgi:hypothetical protein
MAPKKLALGDVFLRAARLCFGKSRINNVGGPEYGGTNNPS